MLYAGLHKHRKNFLNLFVPPNLFIFKTLIFSTNLWKRSLKIIFVFALAYSMQLQTSQNELPLFIIKNMNQSKTYGHGNNLNQYIQQHS